MLHWIYTGIAAAIAALVAYELYEERRWRIQLSLVLVLIPLLLRVLHIK